MLSTLVLVGLLGATPAPDTVVVCAHELQATLAPWLELRNEQGHRCEVVAGGTADVIRQRIRRAAAGGRLRYVLLVGDPSPRGRAALALAAVPTHHVRAKIVGDYPDSANIAGDNWFADLDDDQVPDVAIGRLTTDTVGELQVAIDKILAYERGIAPGEWRRRINFVAGLAGFGQLADATLEAVTKKMLTERIPAAYATTMTYASWRSPYCPDPRQFHAATLDRWNEGCLFWVYIGHGQNRILDRIRVPDGPHHIFSATDVAKLRCAAPPIALFLCCNAGRFDAREDCLAEELLVTPQGPVASLAGSRVTMPYGTSVLAAEMLQAYFEERVETLGELLLAAKRATMLRTRDDSQSKAIDSLALLLNPKNKDLAAERREHLELFNLIGDPLLRVPRASAVRVEVASKVRAGSVLDVIGTSDVDGVAEIELVVRRDRLTFRAPSRQRYETSDVAREEYQKTYARANDVRLASFRATATDGAFRARLIVPDDASGACHVRVFVHGDREVAVGAADVTVEARLGD